MHRRKDNDTSGIYRCTIETTAVHNSAGRETMFVGLYASGGESLTNKYVRGIIPTVTCTQVVKIEGYFHAFLQAHTLPHNKHIIVTE